MDNFQPKNDEEASTILVEQLRRVMKLFHAGEEELFPRTRATIVSTVQVRTPPARVTGVYESSQQFINDAIFGYCALFGCTREQVPIAAMGIFGEIAHLLEFLLRSGCLIYSGRRPPGVPELYVALTETCTHCVAVSFDKEGS